MVFKDNCLKTSIICAVSNHCEITYNFLRDLYIHTNPDDFQLTIIDNGSTDNTPQMLKEFCLEHENIHVIRNHVNRGVPVSWNQGIKYALSISDTKYLLIINNDVRIYGRWLEYLHDAFTDDKMIAGPEVVVINDAVKVDGEQIPYVAGWGFMMPAGIIDDVGYFDPV